VLILNRFETLLDVVIEVAGQLEKLEKRKLKFVNS